MFLDCSSNNGPIDVGAYAGGRAGLTRRRPRWLSRKVTEGDGYHWGAGDGYARQAHTHGLHVVHYHWLTPDAAPSSQANFFLEHVSAAIRPGDVAMIDFEPTFTGDKRVSDGTPERRAAQLSTCARIIAGELRAVPLIVYVGENYLDELGAPAVAAVRPYPVIIPNYSSRPPNRYRLELVGWQFSDRQSFAGVTRPDNDANRWTRSPARLFGFTR